MEEEIHGSETRRRRPKRKPLADLTNTPSSAVAANAPLKPTPSDTTPPPSSIRRSSRTRSNALDRDEATPATTPRAKKSKLISDWDILAHDSTVYKTRTKAGRKRKEKKVASSIASSCPPILRTRSLEGNLNLESCIDYLPKEYSVPNQPAKKERLIRMPEDFIKEQKRYFEEVDAFELPEEDVSDSDLTWFSGQARVHDKKGSPRKIPADP